MEKLIKIIGPAPNELPFEELLQKLSKERTRIVAFLARIRTPAKRVTKGGKKAPAKSKKKTVSPALLAEIAKLTGMSPEQLKGG